MLAPASDRRRRTVAARHPGARVFAVDGTYDDCRRLELELGSLFPWGFVSGNLHPYASEGAKTISFEIAEQLGLAAARRRRLPRRERHALREARAGLRRADPRGPRRASRCRGCSPARPRARARSPTRSPTTAASRACTRRHDVRVARRRQSLARRPGARRRARDAAARCIAVSDDGDRGAHRAAHARRPGSTSDCAGGAALGALAESIRRGEIERGSRVVLVVTGAQPSASTSGTAHVTEALEPDAQHVLAALGLGS